MAAITFIIPACNAATTIGATLQSLCSQTRRDWAAIVIDDGSTDGTRRAVEQNQNPRIRLLTQPNSGVATARNRGLSLAPSDAVCFIDADDTIEPDFIQTMLPRLAGHDLAAAAYRYTDPDLTDVGWHITPAADDHLRLAEFNQFAIGAIVFDRHNLFRLADPAPFPSGTTQEDWSLLLKLTRSGARWAPPFIDRPLFSYRLRPQSRTTALCEIWRDGLNLIAQHQSEPQAREQSLRRWTVRNLARAAAAGDRRLCTLFFEHLDTLTAFDAGTLAGALRWSMRRMAVAHEPQALQSPATWNAQILSALGQDELARDALRRATHPDWDQVAAAAAARLRPNQTLVIYGLGRNGRDLLSALKPRCASLAVIDDAPGAATDLPRLTISQLSPDHIVLVTPDDRSAILSGLRLGRQAQVLLPEQLVA